MTKLAENKPDELIRSSIIRAKFCELAGGSNGFKVNTSELFTLGLFSSIDAILNETMDNLMAKLPLSKAIKDALIHEKGDLNNFLVLVKYYEKGDWQGVSELQQLMNLDEDKLPAFFMQSIEWADAISGIQ